jgi:hypothetical protein
MFHPFLNAPKRKMHNSNTKQQETKTMPISPSPLNLFRQKPASSEPRRPLLDQSSVDMSIYTTESKTTIQYDTMPNSSSPLKLLLQNDASSKPRRPLFDECSSVDMSIYTTESKTTVQYNTNNACCFDFNWQFESPSKAAIAKTVTGTKLNEWKVTNSSSPTTPSTAPSTPEVYGTYETSIAEENQTRRFTCRDELAPKRNTATKRRGPVDLDDESIADDESSTNSWVKSSNGMDSPAISHKKSPYFDKSVDNKAVARGTSPQVSLLWDNEDDGEKDGTAGLELISKRTLSYEDTEIQNRSYHDAIRSIIMRSISSKTLSNDHDDESDSGVVLLTQEELQKHVKKVQTKGPLPSSSIGGYDKWKQGEEGKKRYFDKLQEKAQERSKLRRQEKPAQASPLSPNPSKKYANDLSEELSSFKCKNVPNPRRRWKLLPKFHSLSKKKNESAKKQFKIKDPPVASSNKKMQKSQNQPSEVGNVSLAPLNTMLGMDTNTFGEQNQLVAQLLEEEREKQLQAELGKEEGELKEQERIQRLKERELKRQREMNRRPPTKPMTKPRSISHGPIPSLESMTPSCESTITIGRTASLSSQVSSIQSQSTIVLSPCIVCNVAARNHIAMPCMHFYFCESCVDDMKAVENSICPVCSTENIAFTRVYTG